MFNDDNTSNNHNKFNDDNKFYKDVYNNGNKKVDTKNWL